MDEIENTSAEAMLKQMSGPDPAPASAPTVGIFDSGVGGFTVAAALIKRRPDLNIVYYADSVNLPYGGRSQEQLERFAGSIIEFLLTQGIDILADGCNSSQSALSSGELRSYGVPAYDLVSSTIAWMHERRLPEALALLATEATVRAGWWESQLRAAFPQIPVTAIPAPELVPLIEAQQLDETALRHAVGKYLREVRDSGADTVILGCTHYALVQHLMLETDVYLRYIDPAQCLAERLVSDLSVGVAPARPSPAENASVGTQLAASVGDEAGADASSSVRTGVGNTEEGRAGATHTPVGTLRFYSSKPSERFYEIGARVFGHSIRELTRFYIVNPYED